MFKSSSQAHQILTKNLPLLVLRARIQAGLRSANKEEKASLGKMFNTQNLHIMEQAYQEFKDNLDAAVDAIIALRESAETLRDNAEAIIEACENIESEL